MFLFQVDWSIDIEAKTPQEAAKLALEIQRDADSIATVFDVRRIVDTTVEKHATRIDLSPPEGNKGGK